MVDLSKLLGPAIGTLVRAAIERPVGAGSVAKPLYPEGQVKLPGRRVGNLTRTLSKKLAEQVGTTLTAVHEIEFGDLAGEEWEAAVSAACDTLAQISPITATMLIAMDLDPERLYRECRAQDHGRIDRAALNESQSMAYERILRECSWQIVEFVSRQPEFTRRIQLELIRRTGEIASSVKDLAVTTEPQVIEDFERRYLDLVLKKLDGLQLFGVTLRHSDAYSLSTAYLSLHAAPESVARGGRVSADRLRVHEALADAKRVLIRGEAGSGKTTLLQWLAVNSVQAPQNLPVGWVGAIPFLVPLRRYALQDLPSPALFPREVAPALSYEAPSTWMASVMRSGRALILIDGVDELPRSRRGDVWIWLHDLVVTYPEATYVITSRPPAVDGKVLVPDGFETFMLLPMGAADVRTFVGQWHTAITAVRDDTSQSIKMYETELLEKLARRRDLRRLATNPLLCALICALHLERYRQLPQDRMGLYSAALEMLLVRRDEARGISADRLTLSQQDQEALLGQLAYWLVRNGWSDCERGAAAARISRYMQAMPYVEAKPADVLDFLLLRSGVLREPVVGVVDFLHKTFQEYLAARAILDEGDIDSMLLHAHEDHWREVIVMAIGHGRRDERERIIRGLLERGDRVEEIRRPLYLLAVSCLEHPGALDPELVETVREKASRLVVPEDERQVDLVAAAGEVILDVIPDPTSLTDREGTLLIDAVNRFDIEDTLPVLARIGRSNSRAIRGKLAADWPDAAVEAYAETVLNGMRLDDVTVHVRTERQLRSAAKLTALTDILIEGVSDSLHQLSRHPALRAIMLGPANLSDLKFTRRCELLRSLILFRSNIAEGISSISGLELEEVAVLGIQHGSSVEGCIEALNTLPKLRRLTIDQTMVANGVKLLAATCAVERIDLLASPWMASAIDYTHRDLAWASFSGFNKEQNWRRASTAVVSHLQNLRELSVSGWPSPTELEILRTMGELETLRVVVADDDLRDVVLSAGLEYGYPQIEFGALRTLRSLPSLRRLEIAIFTLERVRSTKWRELTRGHKVQYYRGAQLPTLIQELSNNLPRHSKTEVVINGHLSHRARSDAIDQ
ncbi:NACHT domain-containing protein [Micromonospora sp. NPDC005172]|uniref:NACHT domain-containing protein n=1 Tax=Micromonospora sp. NPDC005172 TaxID=3156867 RepID=UPI0033BBC2B6